MGLFFSKDEAQDGGFQTENVPEPLPQVLFNESARKLSLLDEEYLIPQVSTTPPLTENLDLLALPTSVQMPPEEKYFDPVVAPEQCSLP